MDINSSLSRCKEQIRAIAINSGFTACGFAKAESVDRDAVDKFNKWIDDGHSGCLDYMRNYPNLREDPTLLFSGTKTIISLALNYYPAVKQPSDVPQFSYYAYGKDYHKVARKLAKPIVEYINSLGGECRICVDSAPIRERYWAQKAGIGFIGANNQLILPGKGSYFFLAEILTTLELDPDEPCTLTCGNCRKCVEVCPGNAILDDCRINASRCLSCLTIESPELPREAARALGNRIYGCDMCQQVCPHNKHAVTTAVEEFFPSEEFLSLNEQKLSSMTEDEFNQIFRHSAVKRAKHARLMRNIAATKKA